MPWGISDKATDKEKIKAEFNDFINGLNSVGDIDYPTYSDLFDEGYRLLDAMYECGKNSKGEEQNETN